MERLNTFPFKVASYPAVPPNPKTSRVDRAYSPAPSAEQTIADVSTSTIFIFYLTIEMVIT